MTDAGIAAVLNVAAKTPFAPMVAGCEAPLIVIVTVSPLGGDADPAPAMPDKLIEAVPNGIACEDGNAKKAVVPFCTVRVKACGVEATTLVAVKVTL